MDAPLLFESGLNRQCHRVLSVIAPADEALERIILRDGLSRAEAEKRLASQHPASYYIEKSDYILNNNKGLPALRQETLELLDKLYDEAL